MFDTGILHFNFKKKVKTKRDVTMKKEKTNKLGLAFIINMKGFGICMSVSSI